MQGGKHFERGRREGGDIIKDKQGGTQAEKYGWRDCVLPVKGSKELVFNGAIFI